MRGGTLLSHLFFSLHSASELVFTHHSPVDSFLSAPVLSHCYRTPQSPSVPTFFFFLPGQSSLQTNGQSHMAKAVCFSQLTAGFPPCLCSWSMSSASPITHTSGTHSLNTSLTSTSAIPLHSSCSSYTEILMC